MFSCWTYGTLGTRSRSARSRGLRVANAPPWHQILSVTTITAACSLVKPLTPGGTRHRWGWRVVQHRLMQEVRSNLLSVSVLFKSFELCLISVTRGTQPMTPTWDRVTSSKAWKRVSRACVLERDGSSSSHPSWRMERTARVQNDDIRRSCGLCLHIFNLPHKIHFRDPRIHVNSVEFVFRGLNLILLTYNYYYFHIHSFFNRLWLTRIRLC